MPEKRIDPGSIPLANARWETFCRIYAAGTAKGTHRGNAANSYISAGYTSKDVFSASSSATLLLKKDEIKQRVAYLAREFWRGLNMSNEELIARASAIVRFDVNDMFDPGGSFRNFEDMPEHTRMAIQGVEVQLAIPNATEANPNPITIATKKVKAADKNAALRTLAQIKRMIGPEVQLNITSSLADRLAAARKRAREKGKL